MAFADLNLAPTKTQLRQFGWLAFAALPLIGWLFSGKPSPTSFSTWTGTQQTMMGAFLAAAICGGLLGTLQPSWLRWAFVGASVVTFPIGLVIGEVVMFSVFLLAFVPIALIFRWIGRDALQRKIDKDATTYWQPKPQPKDAASYFRQS